MAFPSLNAYLRDVRQERAEEIDNAELAFACDLLTDRDLLAVRKAIDLEFDEHVHTNIWYAMRALLLAPVPRWHTS